MRDGRGEDKMNEGMRRSGEQDKSFMRSDLERERNHLESR